MLLDVNDPALLRKRAREAQADAEDMTGDSPFDLDAYRAKIRKAQARWDAYYRSLGY